MRTVTSLSVVMLLAMAACRNRMGGGTGSRQEWALASPGQGHLGTVLPAPPGAEVLEGTKEVRGRAWAVVRGLKRKGAWLALGLHVEGERIRLLTLHGHEGSGTEAGAVEAESFRSLMEWALYRYVRGQQGEVVLTLRRDEGMWREEVESTGPVRSATLPEAPYEAFLLHQREMLKASGLAEEARGEGLTALKRLEQWLLLQPAEGRAHRAPGVRAGGAGAFRGWRRADSGR